MVDGRHPATNTSVGGGLSEEPLLPPLCTNEPRRFTGGRAAEIASLFSFFPDDHFPRELSSLLRRIDRLSNSSIGKRSRKGKEMFFHLPSSVR